MFNGRHFYNKSIRNYVVLMGTLFNQVTIKRPHRDDLMVVPISYQSKEKFVAHLQNMNRNGGDPDQPELQTILPRMSFFLRQPKYAPRRKVNNLQYSINVVDKDGLKVTQKQFAPVPYDFEFELCVYTRYEDDMLQIIEQILPYFQPHFNAKIKEYSVAGVVDRDIPINMVDCEPEEELIGLMSDDRRHVIWNMRLVLEGWLYPQISEASLIKRTIVNFVGDESELMDDDAAMFRVTNEVVPLSANEDDPHTVIETKEYPNEQ